MWCWTNARWVTFFYSPERRLRERQTLPRRRPRAHRAVRRHQHHHLPRARRRQAPRMLGHGRRRLVEAARAGDRIALEGVRIIARLFAVERESTLRRRQRRSSAASDAQRLSRPILDELRAWIDRQTRRHAAQDAARTRRSATSHRQWRRLLLFLEDGNIEATNNRRERELQTLGPRSHEIGSSPGSTTAASAPATSCRSSRPASRTTSTRAPTCMPSFTASCTDGRRRDFASSCPIACSSRIPSSTSATPTRCRYLHVHPPCRRDSPESRSRTVRLGQRFRRTPPPLRSRPRRSPRG